MIICFAPNEITAKNTLSLPIARICTLNSYFETSLSEQLGVLKQ
jgi:hypothetical protein